MKIRTGFVSNSSSSSYIVEIKGISEQDFLNKLFAEYSWKHFDKGEIEKDLLERIKNSKATKRDSEKDKISVGKKAFSDLYDNWLKDSENDLIRFKEVETNEELVKFVIEHNGITIKIGEDKIELNAWTSMHNDFHDGMPQLLGEIVLFFIFDTTHKVKCRRIDES